MSEVSEAVTTKPKPELDATDWRLIALIIGIKLLLFVFAVQAFHIWEEKPVPGGPFGWLEIWKQWDVESYLGIAESGYSNDPNRRYLLNFYPLYPWTVRLFALVIGDYYVSAVWISTLASIAAGLLLRRLVELDHSAEIAERAVWFLFIFPTSYFLHTAYTESLFLALVLGCLLAARKERWMEAGLLSAAVCMTRGPGIIIIPTLCIEAWQQYRAARRWRWDWLWIAVALLGYLIFLAVNAKVSGNPFTFMAIARDQFHTSFGSLFGGVKQAFGALGYKPGAAEILGRQLLVFMALTLVCASVTWFKLRPMMSAWITLNLLLLANLSFVVSFPRFTLIMFPIHVLFARLAENRLWHYLLSAWSLVTLGLFVTMFVRGYWTF